MAEATVEEKMASFISGNVKRKQILDVLHKNGSETYESLQKLTRMPNIMLKNVLKGMEEKEVIVKNNDRYSLTENGKKAANILPGQSNKANAGRFDANIRREI